MRMGLSKNYNTVIKQHQRSNYKRHVKTTQIVNPKE